MERRGYLMHTATGRYDDAELSAKPAFYGDPNYLDEIWAMGVRQPFRLSLDTGTGDLYVGDVGEDLREEITRYQFFLQILLLGLSALEIPINVYMAALIVFNSFLSALLFSRYAANSIASTSPAASTDSISAGVSAGRIFSFSLVGWAITSWILLGLLSWLQSGS